MGLSSVDIDKIREVIISVFKNDLLQDLEQRIEHRLQECVGGEITALKGHIQVLNDDIESLKTKNRSLESLLDRQEQSSRGLNIRVFGVKQEDGEDLPGVMVEIFNRVKCSVKTSDIKKCHRVGTKNSGEADKNQRLTRSQSGGGSSGDNRPPAVLVRLGTDAVRTSILRKRKQLDAIGVRVREDLTKFRLSLLAKAIEKFSSKNAWCLHGNVYVKIGDVVHRIEDSSALETLSATTRSRVNSKQK